MTEQPALPEDFVGQVKDALEHLYDFPHLQRHPLTQESRAVGERAGEIAGQNLRRELITAVEALSPGSGTSFRAPHARLYNLLHLHYVEGMTVQEAAYELGVSLRQAYRDLRRGEESVAAVLWAIRRASSPSSSQEPRAIQLSSVQMEVDRLETHRHPTDLRLLVQRAQKAVERLATRRAVTFHIEVPSEPVIVSTDPVVAQQVLTSTLSHAVQQAQPGTLHTMLTADRERVSFTLYIPASGTIDTSIRNQVVAQLADRLGWSLRQEEQSGDLRTIVLNMTARGPTVLVIDDNEGLVDLLDRYLTGHDCQVVAAASGREGLQLAQELIPDAVVLDVMMPETDGWEVLQTLHTDPQTAMIPVIICSVFNDPELAYSLGASCFLPKPVKRDDVMAALRQLGVV